MVDTGPTGRITGLPAWTREAVVVSFLFVLALVLRHVVYVALFTDSISYLGFARNILDGRYHATGITLSRFLYPPLYPHLVALMSGGNPDPFHLAEIGRRVSVLAGALTVIPLYVLARRMFGPWAALTAGLLMVLTPEFLYYSGAVLTESLATLFVTLGMLLLWEISANEYQRLSLPAALGVVLGLAFLTRHASFGFLILSILWILVQWKVLDPSSRWTAKGLIGRFVPVFLVLAGFLIVISPQVLYLHSETGRWTITGNFLTDPSRAWQHAGTDMRYTESAEMGSSLTPDGRRFSFEDQPPPKPLGMISVVRKRPLKFLHAYIRTVFGGYLPDTRPLPYPGVVVTLALLGAASLLMERKYREAGFLTLMFGGFYLFLALFHNIRDRYMFPVLPVLIMLSGAGAALVIKRITALPGTGKTVWRREPVAFGILVMVIFVTLFPPGLRLVSDVNSAYNIGYYRAIHEELSGRIETGALIFDRMPHRAYFAGGEAVRVPYAPVEKVIDFGRYRGVGYWILSWDYVPDLRPQFAGLLRDPGMYGDDLKPLAVYGDGSRRTILFEIVPEDPAGSDGGGPDG